MTFKDGLTTLGTGTVSGGIATLTTSALPAGSRSLSASYGGDMATLSSTSSVVVQSVAASVSGAVSLQKVISGNLGQPITFTFTPTGTTSGSITTQTVTLDSGSGSFTLTGVLPGTYTLGIKGVKWLRKDVSIDTTGGNVSGLTVSLLGGDLNGDNVVDINDFIVLRRQYNQTGPGLVADINCDGQVDINDFILLRSNYNAVGNP